MLAAATRHAHETGYGTAILDGLLLSFAGDILLIPKSQRVFKVGILTFLAGHLAFCVAFIIRGLSLPWALGAGLPLLAAGIPIGRWIVTRAPARLRGAVAVYIGVLSRDGDPRGGQPRSPPRSGAAAGRRRLLSRISRWR